MFVITKTNTNQNKAIMLQENDLVRINKDFGGGTGIITERIGNFIIVNEESFHESDVELLWSHPLNKKQ